MEADDPRKRQRPDPDGRDGGALLLAGPRLQR